jgi:hypothetical protein
LYLRQVPFGFTSISETWHRTKEHRDECDRGRGVLQRELAKHTAWGKRRHDDNYLSGDMND